MMQPISHILDVHGHDPGLNFFCHGDPGHVLIAIGCSWTRAWGWHDNDAFFAEPDRVEDRDFMINHSFVGRVARHLGCTGMINLAIPGSNNDMQTRLLTECVERHRQNLGKIFVLWGITSHVRWELWSTIVNKPTMFMLGGPMPGHKSLERDWWMRYHFDEDFELTRLGQRIANLHGYLRNLDIAHLFFPAFCSYNRHNLLINSVLDQNFFRANNEVNDMMSLMCRECAVTRPSRWLSNPIDRDDVDKVKALMEAGLLSAHAHPSTQGHEFIARQLIPTITS